MSIKFLVLVGGGVLGFGGGGVPILFYVRGDFSELANAITQSFAL